MQGLLALVFLPMLAGPAMAQINPADLLPAERAFAHEARLAPDGDRIEFDWNIVDGYYLYRHAFRFDSLADGLVLGAAQIPPGAAYADEFFGDVEVYRGALRFSMPIDALPESGPVKLRLGFQGCADIGICYPPQRVEIALDRPTAATAPRADPAPTGGLMQQLGLGQTRRELTGRSDPLPDQQAFSVETIALGPDRLLARFTVHPDYYLYRDSIEFESKLAGVTVAGHESPPARSIFDEYFGDTHVYYNEVEIPVALARPAGPEQRLPLIVRFQGCQTDGICYPPMQRQIDVALPAATVASLTAGAPASSTAALDRNASPTIATMATMATIIATATIEPPPESDSSRLQRLIVELPLPLTLALFMLLGIGLAFTPCVFPMIPILSGIIAGEGENVTRAKAFSLSLVYVLAMALTYTVVGVIAALAGYNLQAMFQNPWVLGVFAAIFVALALAMFGFYELQMPASVQAKLAEISNRQSGGSLIGAAIMGFLSALIVGPCVTAPLIGVLGFIAMTGDAVLGGSVLFALSIGMGLPLLAIGVGLGSWLPRAGAWMEAVKAVFGVGLLALAIWMLERVLPGAVTMLLWGALLIGSGVFLGALSRLEPQISGWRKLWQAAGVLLLTLGLTQLIGAAGGGKDWLRPLAPFTGGGSAASAVAAPQFTRVNTLEQLQRAVAAARRPVFLDFYADWCIDCKRMERSSFPDATVAASMARFDLLKIDMTDFNDAHQEVLNAFGLIGPPAFLFFSGGEELTAYRIFGYMPPAEFNAHLQRVERAAL
ncbi:MAG: thiol:disulfide interchange protein [Gammaproteobacteria bacterium HGW-Gammaproteobacteria-8]|nr:MAG: thiol:disulfide interchange protein [Gammaproteobacteria bacterium HGW-Gammaproteobacteria-8]